MSEESADQTSTGKESDVGSGGSERPPEGLVSSLKQDLQGNEILKGFDGPDPLARAYLELREKSSGGIHIPGENATDEQKTEFFTKLGRPETSDGYEFKAPELPKESPVKYDLAFAKAFRDKFHELGISKAAGEGAFGLYTQLMTESATAHEGAISRYEKGEATEADTAILAPLAEQAKRYLVAESNFLTGKAEAAQKKKWGDQYDGNLELAGKGLVILAESAGYKAEDLQGALAVSNLGNNPILADIFKLVGETVSEDKTVFGKKLRAKKGPKVDSRGRPMLDFDTKPT